jgi:general secretion pathway protein G
MKPSKRRQRGFTLIEVLLVLVILVILASLATYNILAAQKKAYKNTARTQIELLDKAMDGYQLDIGSYPSNLQALRSPPADIPDPSKWAGPYLSREVPLDPWKKPYTIQSPIYLPQLPTTRSSAIGTKGKTNDGIQRGIAARSRSFRGPFASGGSAPAPAAAPRVHIVGTDARARADGNYCRLRVDGVETPFSAATAPLGRG